MRKSWLAGISLVLAVALLGAVGCSTPPSGKSSKSYKELLQFTKRLVPFSTSPTPFSTGIASKNLNILPGKLPEKMPVEIPKPRDAKIIGSVVGSGKHKKFYIILNVPQERKEILKFYRENLKEAGWKEQKGKGISSIGLFFSRYEDKGPSLRILVVPKFQKEKGPADVRLFLNTSPRLPFPPSHKDKGVIPSLKHPQTLEPPQNANWRGGGGSGGKDHWTRHATLATKLSAKEVEAHYRKQLLEAGWKLKEKGGNSSVAWSTYRVTNKFDDIWAASLFLRSFKGEKLCYLNLSVRLIGTSKKSEQKPKVGKIVKFPDPKLENAIREAIDKPKGEIFQSELEELKSFSANDKNIHDLTGLGHCTSLQELELRFNRITDISPLSKLKKLEVLKIDNNQIGDISPLSGLTKLRRLNLRDNQITDISPLSRLTKLQSLELGGNRISDVSSLSSLTDLEHLGLGLNLISDISPLSKLTKLRYLSLGRNQISNLSPLSDLTNLWGLYLQHNQINNISPLSKLANLRELYLEDNRIENISPLSKLTNLAYLDLSNNQISDISPLVKNKGIGKRDQVDLRGNPLSKASLNDYIPQLQEKGVEVKLREGEEFHPHLSPLPSKGEEVYSNALCKEP